MLQFLICWTEQNLISWMQPVQNAAVRLLTATWKWNHIPVILKSLHWLPVTYRINLKMLLLTCKCFCGLAPVYSFTMLYSMTLTLLTSCNFKFPIRLYRWSGILSQSSKTPWNHLVSQVKSSSSATENKHLLISFLIFRLLLNFS